MFCRVTVGWGGSECLVVFAVVDVLVITVVVAAVAGCVFVVLGIWVL